MGNDEGRDLEEVERADGEGGGRWECGRERRALDVA